jgi:hypothetical protein
MKFRDNPDPAKRVWHLVGILALIALALVVSAMRAPAAAPVEHAQADTDVRIDLGVVSVRVTIS